MVNFKGITVDPVKALKLMKKIKEARAEYYRYLSGGLDGPNESFNEYDMEDMIVFVWNDIADIETPEIKALAEEIAVHRRSEWETAMDWSCVEE